MNDVHTCSYYCDRPACIKAQRDELRDKFQVAQAQAEIDAKAQRIAKAQAPQHAGQGEVPFDFAQPVLEPYYAGRILSVIAESTLQPAVSVIDVDAINKAIVALECAAESYRPMEDECDEAIAGLKAMLPAGKEPTPSINFGIGTGECRAMPIKENNT
jgi:hypothetical protein